MQRSEDKNTRRQLFFGGGSNSGLSSFSSSQSTTLQSAPSVEAQVDIADDGDDERSSFFNVIRDTTMGLQQQFAGVSAVNFREENIYAELAEYAESILYHLGSRAPAQSPSKLKSLQSINRRLDQQGEAYLKSLTLFGSALDNSVQSFWVSKEIERQIDQEGGRNMSRLMKAARSLEKAFSTMSFVEKQNYLSRYINGLSDELLEQINKKLNPIGLIVLLKLVEKYPLYPVERIVTSLDYALRFGKQKVDIYKCYEKLDDSLKNFTLTRQALKPYLEADEIKNNWRKSEMISDEEAATINMSF